jgi:hypothetical protein
MPVENRRDQRYRTNLSVFVTRGKERTQLLTEDVSFRGMFLRTDSPGAPRQLVRIDVLLPDHHQVSSHAMVVHVVQRVADAPESRHVPGVGVQFWGEINGRAKWDAFIQELTKDPSKRVVAAPGTPDPVRRSSSRFRIKLEVRLPDLPEMLGLATRDMSEDGMSVATEVSYPPGLKTRLILIHPSTAEAFPIDVIVRRQIKEPNFTGLGVEFIDKSPETRARLRTFLRIPREELEEEVIFVEEDDPALQ